MLAVLSNRDTTFMDDDIEILRRHFAVDVIYRTDYRRTHYEVLDIAKRLLVHRPKLLYCWFVWPWDTAAMVFLTRLLGVRSVLQVGGYDIANMPEIEYGMMRFPKARPWTRFALNWANLVIPFSEFSKNEVARVANPRHMQVINPGVDVDIFQPGNGEKQALAITVGTVGRRHFRRKGLETFAKCSRMMPQIQFAIIGRVVDNEILEHLKSLGSDNLHFTLDRVTTEELVNWYQRAKVYVQASAHEGFGVAVAEAMACECVPVVTSTTALPEVVGDVGFYTIYDDLEITARAIEKALKSENGPAARQRVVDNFTLAHREAKLLKAINSLFGCRSRNNEVMRS